jgi:hypothetical protein
MIINNRLKIFLANRITQITFIVILLLVGIGIFVYWILGANEQLPWSSCNIHYIISDKLSKNKRQQILDSFKLLEQNSSLKFKEKTSEIEFMEFVVGGNENSCGSSLIGKRLGGQIISINESCDSDSPILHEIMHALGFQHEHQRPDRDLYVNIFSENVENTPEKIELFKNNVDKKNSGLLYDKIIKNRPYDTKSIMHYSSLAFSKGKSTILKKPEEFILRNTELSDEDKLRLKEYCNIFK